MTRTQSNVRCPVQKRLIFPVSMSNRTYRTSTGHRQMSALAKRDADRTDRTSPFRGCPDVRLPDARRILSLMGPPPSTPVAGTPSPGNSAHAQFLPRPSAPLIVQFNDGTREYA